MAGRHKCFVKHSESSSFRGLLAMCKRPFGLLPRPFLAPLSAFQTLSGGRCRILPPAFPESLQRRKPVRLDCFHCVNKKPAALTFRHGGGRRRRGENVNFEEILVGSVVVKPHAGLFHFIPLVPPGSRLRVRLVGEDADETAVFPRIPPMLRAARWFPGRRCCRLEWRRRLRRHPHGRGSWAPLGRKKGRSVIPLRR